MRKQRDIRQRDFGRHRMGRIRLGVLAAGLGVIAANRGFGQTFIWNGGGGDDFFGTGANWVGGGTPGVGSGIVLRFDGSIRPTPNNNYTVGDDFGEWHLNSTAGADFTISGNLFGLHGKIENDTGSGRLFTINTGGIVARDGTIEINPVGGNIVIGSSANVFLDNNARLDVYDGNFGRTLTINSSLDNGNGSGGNGALVLNQTATVVLTGTNDYGGTTINSGATLRVGAGGTTGTVGQGSVTNNGALIFSRSNAYTVANAIGGPGTVTKESTGVLTLSGGNTYSGSTTILDGGLSISGDGNLGTAPGSATAAHLVINGGTLATTGGTFTINANRGIALGPTSGSGSGTVDLGGSAANGASNSSAVTVSYNGIIANNALGTGALVKTGRDILSLGGNNSFSGGVTIQESTAGGYAGVITATANNALGTTGTVNIFNVNGVTGNVNNNAELRLSNVTTPAGVTLNVNSGSGDRRTNLRGITATTSTWGGPITLSGTMGSVFQVHADGNLTIDNSVTAGSGFATVNTYRGGGSGTVTGNVALGSTGTMAKNDASTWVFQGTNSFGTLNIAQGTARFTQPIGTGIPTGATILMNANTSGSPALETNGTLPSRSLGNTAGLIQMSSALQTQNVGLSARGGNLSLSLTGSPAFGAMVGGVTATANAGATSISVSSTTGLAVGMTITGSNIVNGATITVIGTGTIGIGTATTGALSGTAVTAAVTGSATATTINAPTLNLNATGNSNANITFNNGFDVNVRGSAARTLNVGAQTVTITGAVTNSVANNGTLTKSGAGTLAMTGGGSGLDMLRLTDGRVDLGGTWSLRRIATNSTNNLTLNIAGATTTTMVDFAAQFVGDQTSAATSTVNIQSGGSWTQDRTGGNERDFAIANGAGSQDAKAVVNVDGNFTITANVNQIGIGGSTRATGRAATGSLNINNGGVASIQGTPAANNKIFLGAASNIYGGGTPTASTVQAGTIVLNSGGTLRTSRTITEGAQLSNITSGRFFFNGGTLSATAGVGNSDWMSGLTGAYVQSGGAVFNTNGADMSIAQPLEPDTIFSSGPGSVTKWGAGTLTLSGNNSYAGTTTINAGLLRVNGTHTGGGVYVVGDGTNAAALGGTGSTTSAVNISNNATLSPGNSIGTLATGDLSFTAGGNYLVELDVDPLGGTSADQVQVTGTVNVAGANLVFSFVAGSVGPLIPNQTFVIVTNDLADPVTGTFAQAPTDDALSNLGNLAFKVDYNYDADTSTFDAGNDIALTIVFVPEPGCAWLLAGMTGALRRRRR